MTHQSSFSFCYWMMTLCCGGLICWHFKDHSCHLQEQYSPTTTWYYHLKMKQDYVHTAIKASRLLYLYEQSCSSCYQGFVCKISITFTTNTISSHAQLVKLVFNFTSDNFIINIRSYSIYYFQQCWQTNRSYKTRKQWSV